MQTKLILLTLLLLSSFFIPLTNASVTIKRNTIFKTSGNNAQFVLGSTFAFHKVEINSTHLWLDKAYSAKHYSRYCIYVISPNDAIFTIDSWFATKDSTAHLTITNPTSTNISIGFYSPNLLTASVTGATTSQWITANQTLLFTTNTDKSNIFIISTTVNETLIINTIPENYAISIIDMEGCGNWVFSQEQYYSFQAQYWDGDGYSDLDTCKIAFTDGVNWINASYDVSASAFTFDSGSDVANLQAGTITVADPNLLQVVFKIYFKNTILDALNVDLYMWCNDTSGAIDGWDLIEPDYFNIYNLGGHSTLTVGGLNAGRIQGGDVFELYAYNDSSAEAYMTFRSLQHVKMLMTLMGNGTGIGIDADKFRWTYYIDYCLDTGEWVTGWALTIQSHQAYYGTTQYWNLTAEWYNRGALIKSEDFWTYQGRVYSPITTQLWIDLWFNKQNASTVIGGRVNAYFYPMKDTSNPWLQWLTGSNWGADDTLRKQSMFFDTLKDADNNTCSTFQIKMVKLGCRVEVGSCDNATSLNCQASDYDVFDLTVDVSPFEGVQTPVFDETRVPVMPQGGFLGAVVSALSSLGNKLAEMFGPALLNFWNAFVGFLDSIFTALGWTNGFSQILSIISNFVSWLSTAITILIAILISVFNIIVSGFTIIASTVVDFFNALIGFGANLVWIWDAVYPYWGWIPGTLYQALPLLFLFYILWVVNPFFTNKSLSGGLEGTKRNFENTIGLVIRVVMFLWHVIDFAIDTVYRLAEMIPVVE